MLNHAGTSYDLCRMLSPCKVVVKALCCELIVIHYPNTLSVHNFANSFIDFIKTVIYDGCRKPVDTFNKTSNTHVKSIYCMLRLFETR